jgi:hypothetical protein
VASGRSGGVGVLASGSGRLCQGRGAGVRDGARLRAPELSGLGCHNHASSSCAWSGSRVSVMFLSHRRGK